MTKKNGIKSMNQRKDRNGINSIMLAFIAFIFGYSTATIFDLEQVQGWINKKIQTKQDSKPQSYTQAKKKQVKPRLEFYTLLPQDKPRIKTKGAENIINPPVDLSVTKKLPPPSHLTNNLPNEKTKEKLETQSQSIEKYMIQVASFKNKIEADKMRAELTIQGFDVSISTINQQQTNWYRVMIGPVSSKNEAEKLKITLTKQTRIDGMIRKV